MEASDREDSVEETTSLLSANEKSAVIDTGKTDVDHHHHDDDDDDDMDAPKDRFHLAYWIFFLLGTGVLLPWNAFISAPDYFGGLYGESFLIYVGMTYSLPNLLGLLLVVFFAYRIPIAFRTVPSFVLSLVVLAAVPMLGVIGIAQGVPGFVLTLLFVVVVALCTAILQGGVFGLAGIFPPRMIQAVMSGNGLAGVLVCVIRIVTKLTVEQPRGEPPVVSDTARLISTSIYFYIGALVIALCVVTFIILLRLPYAVYYLRKAGVKLSFSAPKTTSKMGINDEDTGPVETIDYSDHGDNLYGEEDEEPVTDVMITAAITPKSEDSALVRVGKIFKKTYPMLLLQWFVFTVTILIFPGISSNTKSANGDVMCREWLPIILTTIFNVFDFIGRSLPRWVAIKSKAFIAVATISRVIFFALFAIYINPRPEWLMSFDIAPIVTMVLMAFSNGYLTTMIFMLNGPSVNDNEKETAGSMMTFFLLLGVNSGSNLSLLAGMVLFPGAPTPCPIVTPSY